MSVDRKSALLNARLASHRRKVEKAEAVVKEAISIGKNPYVAFSCGKDSAAMLHLVLKHAPDTVARIILWDESKFIGDFDEVIDAWRARGARIEVLRLSRTSLLDKVSDRWEQLQSQDNHDMFFVGLRASESMARKNTLRRHGQLYLAASGLWRVCPLAWMTDMDIASIVETNDLPVLRVYKDHGYSERTATRVPREQVRGEFLSAIQERDPVRYLAFKRAFPELEGM
ncbi:phosphoadenosine phosphosulfate reductase family protein [Rhodovulum euryhalinum]|uniref:Sulfate adenylyltransferase subunit 2 n=1 Tax=Rhodovulum euryhalinum TaxID=35805 RepID=A0A4R2KU66_9RHOB|nr:phosphoadenosine phosphosulfate reductase family protein [Rhodovulum euryhalinum]TCO70255.1 sulfate adenylyltransferase subunit 2 [Rhodovulum euryhalinum]